MGGIFGAVCCLIWSVYFLAPEHTDPVVNDPEFIKVLEQNGIALPRENPGDLLPQGS